jgi:hypothetical protein
MMALIAANLNAVFNGKLVARALHCDTGMP